MPPASPGQLVRCESARADRQALAAELAGRVQARSSGLPQTAGQDAWLAVLDDRIELCSPDAPAGRGVWADWAALNLTPGSGNLSRKQPLARAIGSAQTVVDATAGLGYDSVLLAALGYGVTAMERRALVFEILHDAYSRALMDNRLANLVRERVQLVFGDARTLLPTLLPQPDAVYIDPMFPPKRKKSALAKKEIRVVRSAAGDDVDAAEVVSAALAVAGRRVVVKRPDGATPLAANPTASYAGKLVRYDMYAVSAIYKPTAD